MSPRRGGRPRPIWFLAREILHRAIMAHWIVAERAMRLEHRAITLDGQPKMAMGFTTYVLACSPRRSEREWKAS